MGIDNWPLILKLGHNIWIWSGRIFLHFPSFFVTWLWTLQKHQFWRVDRQSRTGIIYYFIVFARLGLKVKVKVNRQRRTSGAYGRGNAVMRSVWPRSSIEYSFSSFLSFHDGSCRLRCGSHFSQLNFCEGPDPSIDTGSTTSIIFALINKNSERWMSVWLHVDDQRQSSESRACRALVKVESLWYLSRRAEYRPGDNYGVSEWLPSCSTFELTAKLLDSADNSLLIARQSCIPTTGRRQSQQIRCHGNAVAGFSLPPGRVYRCRCLSADVRVYANTGWKWW